MKDFQNFQEFYEFVNSNLDVREQNPPVVSFCEAVEKINVGCGCQKKARVQRAERFYLALAHELSQGGKLDIKQKFPEDDTVRLLHGGNVFLLIR
jgi:hypothetical protein